jgi:endoglucanase
MTMGSLSAVLAGWLVAAVGVAEMPEIVHAAPVAPDIVAVTVSVGRVEYGRQVPYEPQDADGVDTSGYQRWVRRGGRVIGALVGSEHDVLHTMDRYVGPRFDAGAVARADRWRVSTPDDERYAGGEPPTAVHRKSRPTDVARVGPWQFEAPVEHTFYLRLPAPLAGGSSYTVEAQDGVLPPVEFRHEPERLRSEAVHVSHLGYRPDDPAKVAFLSCWMGDGGGVSYPEGLAFRVLEDSTGREAAGGRVVPSRRAEESEDAYGRNYNGADVWRMDFSGLSEPGTYRVCVDGVGCSFPFRIADDAWRRAFYVSARGFYHQRSGIELGPPCTEFRRPRCFHPDDGVVVYHSTCPLMDSGNGLNAKGTDTGNFGNLVAGRTDQVVPDAWGAYMDAGDWDRRIQHLVVTRYLVELAEMFPDYFRGMDLDIPESGGALPDVVDEGLFNLGCYRRMQTPEGGIRGGIESEEHPRHGEASWQESLTVLAYAPGVWSSYVYAGVAGRAARCLAPRDAGLADEYRESALRAMEWAEENFDPGAGYPHAVNDDRNLAAAELFRLSGDERWHTLFLETTAFRVPGAELFVWQDHEQREAAWVYLRTDRADRDEEVLANCRAALLREADSRAAATERSGYTWAKYEWAPGSWGAFTGPDAVTLVRAHALTADERYLRAAVLACQTGGGANPLNLCYTTGLGHRSPQHPLHIDSRITHQPAPPGLTVGGPMDVTRDPEYFGTKVAAPYCYPDVMTWPALECYFDIFWSPVMCEYTVQSPMAANAYVWGYLAAR